MATRPIKTLQAPYEDVTATAAKPLPHRVFATVHAWFQQRRTERALTACSDRVLADIGIAREDIPLVARGCDPRTAGATTGWFASLRASLEQEIAAHRKMRRERAELMAYSDAELADLGIRRRDIPAILKGAPGHAPA